MAPHFNKDQARLANQQFGNRLKSSSLNPSFWFRIFVGQLEAYLCCDFNIFWGWSKIGRHPSTSGLLGRYVEVDELKSLSEQWATRVQNSGKRVILDVLHGGTPPWVKIRGTTEQPSNDRLHGLYRTIHGSCAIYFYSRVMLEHARAMKSEQVNRKAKSVFFCLVFHHLKLEMNHQAQASALEVLRFTWNLMIEGKRIVQCWRGWEL